MLNEAIKQKDELTKDLDKVRTEVVQKKASNQTMQSKNRELEHEVEKLEQYSR